MCKVLLIKETRVKNISNSLKKNGFDEAIIFQDIRPIEKCLAEVLKNDIDTIIVGASFLRRVVETSIKGKREKDKKYDGNSVGVRFIKRNIDLFQPWIQNKKLILIGSSKNHQIEARDLGLKFIEFKNRDVLSLLIKTPQ